MNGTAVLELQVKSDQAVSGLKSFQSEAKGASSAASGLQDTLAALASTWALIKAEKWAQDSVNLAARYQTLGVVMGVVGANIGKSRVEMDNLASSLEKTGISMIESRQNLIKMAQAHLDLSQATKLARVAQDAAVIGNINSSEAFGRLITGIQEGNVLMLRNIGINVQFEAAYKKAAETMGKSATELSAFEKAQIRANVVLEAGKTISGAYANAMDTAAKQLRSTERYMEDMRVKAGTAFLPEYTALVFAYAAALEYLGQHAALVTAAISGVVAALGTLSLTLTSVKLVSWLASGGPLMWGLAAAAVAVGIGVAAWAKHVASARAELETFREGLRKVPKEQLEAGIAASEQELVRLRSQNSIFSKPGQEPIYDAKTAQLIKETTDRLNEYKAALKDVTAPTSEQAAAAAAAAAATEKQKEALQNLRAEIATSVTGMTASAAAYRDHGSAAGQAAEREAAVADAITKTTAQVGAEGAAEAAALKWKEFHAQENLRLAQSYAAVKEAGADEFAQQQLERDSIGKTATEVEHLNVAYWAASEIRKANLTLEGDALTLRLQQIDALKRQKDQVIELAAADQQNKDRAQQAADELKKADDARAQSVKQASVTSETMTKDIQRNFSSFLTSIATEGPKSFENFFHQIYQMWVKLLADLASKNIVDSLMSGAGGLGALAGVFGMAKAPAAGLPTDQTGPLKGVVSKDAVPVEVKNAQTVAHQLAGGVLAGIGGAAVGYGVGAATGNTAAGVLSGAASGALMGSAAGPWGAVIGGLMGAVGGFFGAAAAQKEAAEKMKEAAAAFATNLSSYVASSTGGNLAAKRDADLAKAYSDYLGLVKQFNGAWDNGTKRVINALGGWDKVSAMSASQLDKLPDSIQKAIGQIQELDGAFAALKDNINAEYLKEISRGTSDLYARLLSAGGNSRASSDFAFSTTQANEWQDAVTKYSGSKEGQAYLDLLKQVLEAERTRRASDQQFSDQQAAGNLQVQTLTALGKVNDANSLQRQLTYAKEWKDAMDSGMSDAYMAALKLSQGAREAKAQADQAAQAIQDALSHLNQQFTVFGTNAKDQLKMISDLYGFSGLTKDQVLSKYTTYAPGEELTQSQKDLNTAIASWLQAYNAANPAASASASTTASLSSQSNTADLTSATSTQMDSTNALLASANIWLADIAASVRVLRGGSMPSVPLSVGATGLPGVAGQGNTILVVQISSTGGQTLGQAAAPVIDRLISQRSSALRQAAGLPRSVN